MFRYSRTLFFLLWILGYLAYSWPFSFLHFRIILFQPPHSLIGFKLKFISHFEKNLILKKIYLCVEENLFIFGNQTLVFGRALLFLAAETSPTRMASFLIPCSSICQFTTCMPGAYRVGKGYWSPGTGVSNGCEPLRGMRTPSPRTSSWCTY